MEMACIGVDVGGTNLRFALVDREGTVRDRIVEPSDPCCGYPRFLERFLAALERLAGEAREAGTEVAGVGVGLPGLVSAEGVISSSVNFPCLEGRNLAREVEQATGLRTLALNDANACAIAEQRFGAARGYRSSMTLTLGTGVGAGLILDGRLWTGADGAAGEFGHITVEPQGRPCGCGNRGCLEQYSSATAISRGSGDAASVARRAHDGDAEALALFEEAGSYLGIAAAGVVNLLNLEAIVLAGGVAGSFELLAPSMRREMTARSFPIPGNRVRLEKGMLGADAGVLGAAAAACDALRGPR